MRASPHLHGTVSLNLQTPHSFMSHRNRKLAQKVIREHFKTSHLDITAIPEEGSRVFRAKFHHGQAIVKISATRAEESLLKEADIYRFLNLQGIPHPRLLASGVDTFREKSFLILEDLGTTSLLNRLHGFDKNVETLFHDMGKLFARVHSLPLPTHPERHQGIIPTVDTANEQEKGRLLISWIEEHKYASNSEIGIFSELPLPNISGDSLCHNDFNPSHCLLHEDKIIGIVDWENGWVGNRLMDLAFTHAYLDYSCRVEYTQAFLAGYHSILPIPREYVKGCLSLRILQLFGMIRQWHKQNLHGNIPRALSLFRLYLEHP